ncbi:MAG: glycosyltransferase family 2 protein [Leptolyngbyaceae cyanobacterium CSU_1_3]|nr:glycosyltransferase family 2 protein [Leptolyngbyaceae cyanobacterium CSU_1_3]
MTSNSPLISIVIPTLDRAHLLRQALASLQHQTLQDWEALVVDDGSQDSTEQEIMQMSHLDPRIHYLKRSGEKAGANICRNLGTRHAQGKYVIYLDSDDCLSPESLAQRFQCMEKAPDLDFGLFPCIIFREHWTDLQLLVNDEKDVNDIDRFLGFDMPWQTMCPIWRREALNLLGDWDEELSSWQDFEFHFRALTKGFKYQRFPYPDCFWRVFQDGSISDRSRSSAQLNTYRKLLVKLQKMLTSAELLTPQRLYLLGGFYFWLMDLWAKEGDQSEALEIWLLGYECGVINARFYRQGVLYIHASTSRWLPYTMLRRVARRLLREYFKLTWPEKMLPKPSTTFRNTPLSQYATSLIFE